MFDFRGTALVFLLAVAASASAQATVTLQEGLNGYSGSGDAWIWTALRTPTTCSRPKAARYPRDAW